MPAPDTIRQLVATFEQNREAYRSGKYNEAQLRHQFLDKFFEALGWDVYNRAGYPPENCEVVIEDSLEVEGSFKKAPDYAFRLGHDRKFFVEAKKPAVDIKYDIHPAYQLRRYAWNAGLPLSILTDFEELAIYNCKSKPNPTDTAATSRDKFYHYTDYIEKWDEIAAIFSREAVWNGSFDKFASESKGKKGTTEVDDEILKTISEWRLELARNIALRNKPLIRDESLLNYAVQMTIDRILFLRICEDRGIEPEDQLKSISAAPNVYSHLVELFKRADTKYNSGLFHLKSEKGETTPADTFTPSLAIDDKVLKDIITGIYYPCPYIFKEIPVEILGQVYEQFLGKVVRLTPAGIAKVEEKPEVRKAGGVYYTPTYIVDYIVNNTVGKLLEDKTPEQASSLKIVDPACGSGSFLLGAFEYLLNWHHQYYTTHDPESWAKKKNPPIFPVGAGWRLTTAEKKRILTNNLHGVDIDAQAVEVTKLSLLLKVLEEESGQLTLGFERVLPDLGRNIQCGNSLIGWDYFEGQLTIDEEERKRVNPFDWQRAFPHVFAQGGFDAVIGNPPYIRTLSLEKDKKYFNKKFKSAYGAYDIYVLFMEKSIELIKVTGLIGLITPNKYFVADYAKGIRKEILNHASIVKIADFGKCRSLFEGAFISTAITILTKEKTDPKIALVILNDETKEKVSEIQESIVPLSRILTKKDEIRIYSEDKTNNILAKIDSNSLPLNSFAQVRTGVMGFDYWEMEKYISDDFAGIHIATNSYIDRYEFLWGKKVRLFKKDYYEPRLNPSCKFLSENTLEFFNSSKVIVRGVAQRLTAMLDEDGTGLLVAVHGVIGKKYSNKFLLGLLNSRLLNWIHIIQFYSARIPEGSLRYPISFLSDLPIPKMDLSKSTELITYNQIVSLVDRMLDLHKRTPATPQQQEQLAREIAATDHQIDQLVYQLYNLTPDEIAIIEG